MTVRFGQYRLAFYVCILLLSGTVLGLAGHFADVFLPRLNRDITIFSLIVPSLTIFVFLITLQWATPRTEAIQYFVLGAIWLAEAAWITDIIGPLQCSSQFVEQGSPVTTNRGTMSFQQYCYEMKVMQAFSWMTFISLWLGLVVLLSLVSQAERFGRFAIWIEPIRELGWFGEYPGYYNQYGTGMVQYPGGYPQGYPGQGMMPGQSIIVQPNANGPPTVTTVPLGA